MRVRTWGAEDILKQYTHDILDNRGHIADIAEIRQQMELDRIPSTTKTPLGMRKGGTFNMLGSIPIEVWNADEALRPQIPHDKRARDLLRRFPEFAIGR